MKAAVPIFDVVSPVGLSAGRKRRHAEAVLAGRAMANRYVWCKSAIRELSVGVLFPELAFERFSRIEDPSVRQDNERAFRFLTDFLKANESWHLTNRKLLFTTQENQIDVDATPFLTIKSPLKVSLVYVYYRKQKLLSDNARGLFYLAKQAAQNWGERGPEIVILAPHQAKIWRDEEFSYNENYISSELVEIFEAFEAAVRNRPILPV